MVISFLKTQSYNVHVEALDLCFKLITIHYHVLPYPKQRKVKFEPWTKSNHNGYTKAHCTVTYTIMLFSLNFSLFIPLAE